MRLLSSADAELADRALGPGRCPSCGSGSARMLVSRSTSASIQSCISSSRVGRVRAVAGVRCHSVDSCADRRPSPCGGIAPPIDTRSFISVVSDTPPAVADVAEPLGVGDAHVGEVHLVELGLAGHLAQRPHLDAGRVHVDDEVRSCPCACGARGRCGRRACPSRDEVGERGPHLLAVDDPLVAVAHARVRQAGDVGAGAGLAEQLAPDLLAGEQRAQVAAASARRCRASTTVGAHMP